jgi:GNAT superfamily N-acetyltransferase
MGALQHAWSFDRDLLERSAARVEHFEQGAALFDPDLPRVYDANFIRLDSALADMTPDDVIRLADALQRGLGHRKVVMPEGGARLAAGLAERGWSTTATVVMAWDGSPPAEHAAAEIVDPRSLRGARESALGDRHAETRRQIAECSERRARANGVRTFAAFCDGEVGSFCALYEGGGVGEIDEVTTIERFRRRGLGTAVVEAAVATSLAAGNELTYLVAEADGWPRRWYERLGFRAIGTRHEAYIPRPLP